MCFHFRYIRRPRKVEKEKVLNHHKQESNKKGCVGTFTVTFTFTIIMHTALAHSEPSQTSKMVESFPNMAECECLVLKLTIKSKGLVKKA